LACRCCDYRTFAKAMQDLIMPSGNRNPTSADLCRI
jgi:hypothetical protein